MQTTYASNLSSFTCSMTQLWLSVRGTQTRWGFGAQDKQGSSKVTGTANAQSLRQPHWFVLQASVCCHLLSDFLPAGILLIFCKSISYLPNLVHCWMWLKHASAHLQSSRDGMLESTVLKTGHHSTETNKLQMLIEL